MAFEFLETEEYPQFEAVGVEGRVVGDRVQFRAYEWVRVGGVLRRRVVVGLTRPLFGMAEEYRDVWRQFPAGSADDLPQPRPVVILQ